MCLWVHVTLRPPNDLPATCQRLLDISPPLLCLWWLTCGRMWCSGLAVRLATAVEVSGGWRVAGSLAPRRCSAVFGINHLVRGFTRRPAAMMQLPAEGAWPRPLCSPLAPGNPPPSLRPPLRAKSLFLSQSSIITKYKWLSTFIHVNKCLFIFPRGSGGAGTT